MVKGADEGGYGLGSRREAAIAQGGEPANDHDGWNPGADASDGLTPRSSGLGPGGWRSLDAALRDRVLEHLLRDRILDAGGVEVRAEQGVVILLGTVRHASDVRLAEILAREVCEAGQPAAEVVNHLRWP